jgi:glutamate/tyrosine decarboxylase-like PLP-dependent enzyme
MKKRLARLRRQSRALEPDAAQRAAWTRAVLKHAETFLQSLPTQPAFRACAEEGRGILESPLTEQPLEPRLALKLLADHVEAPGVKLGSPGFLAFIPVSSLYPAALGDYLAAVTNPYAGNFFASPGAVRLEHMLIRWMAGFLGYPKSAAGDLTSGGSVANLSAIVAAREAHQLKARDYEKAVVYLSDQTHHSVTKALRIAGLGGCVRRIIPLDARYRMLPAALKSAIALDRRNGLRPWLVVASAGSTDTGAIDPLEDIAEIVRRDGLWLHVDGAYGAMFALCPPGKKVLSGMELSDSLTLDPHKGLFMPCGSGAVLVQNGRHLLNAFRYEAPYMQDRPSLASLEEVSPSELSPELTRPFRGLRLWLSLKLLGLRAFRAALEEKLLLARYFYDSIRREPQVQAGPAPQLSVVTFRYLPRRGEPNELNARLLRAVQQDGRVLLTSTRIGGQFWIRLAVLCAATHREHIDLALGLLREKVSG